jgi:DNA invertase Pin-like site-specific DNA recombinase
MAQVLAFFAELERRLIGERTKAALAVRRAEGIRLGRPSNLPADLIARIVELRKSGRTLRSISDQLNEEGVPTSQGGGINGGLERSAGSLRRQKSRHDLIPPF